MIGSASRPAALVLAGTTLMAFLPQPAEAGPDSTGQPAVEPAKTPEQEKAQKFFEQGLTFLEEENWNAALVSFEESIKAFPTASALFNKAMCLKGLQRYKEAIADLEKYLEVYGEEVGQERKLIAKSTLEDLRARLATLTILVDVEGATVYIDGKKIGESPVAGQIEVSSTDESAVLVTKDGYTPAEEKIRVPPGSDQVLEIALKKVAQVGRLIVESNEAGAAVEVDGAPAGTVPLEMEIAAGSHEVVVTAKGWKPWKQTVVIEVGKDRIVAADLSREKSVNKGWFWAMFALAALSGASAGVTGGLALKYDDEYEQDKLGGPPTWSEIYEDWDRAHGLAIGADVSIGLLAASGLTAIILAFVTDWKGKPAKEKKTASVALVAEIAAMDVRP